jgi:hypothetical protein
MAMMARACPVFAQWNRRTIPSPAIPSAPFPFFIVHADCLPVYLREFGCIAQAIRFELPWKDAKNRFNF